MRRRTIGSPYLLRRDRRIVCRITVFDTVPIVLYDWQALRQLEWEARGEPWVVKQLQAWFDEVRDKPYSLSLAKILRVRTRPEHTSLSPERQTKGQGQGQGQGQDQGQGQGESQGQGQGQSQGQGQGQGQSQGLGPEPGLGPGPEPRPGPRLPSPSPALLG